MGESSVVEHTQPPAVRRRGLSAAAMLVLGGAVVAPVGAIGTASAAAPAAVASLTAPVFRVVSEGLTPDTADALARRAGIGNALLPDGSFAFVDTARFGVVPSVRVGTGLDEHDRPTMSEAIDVGALERITTLPEPAAREKAAGLLPVPAGYGSRRPWHTPRSTGPTSRVACCARPRWTPRCPTG